MKTSSGHLKLVHSQGDIPIPLTEFLKGQDFPRTLLMFFRQLRSQSVVPLGDVRILPQAAEELTAGGVLVSLLRHAHGSWGNVSSADVLINEQALDEGGRLLSQYETGTPHFIITEADRQRTTILLPEEYLDWSRSKEGE